MSLAMESLEGRIDAVATNGVRLGSHSTLVAVVSHFPKLKPELELLRSEHNADLTEDEVDTLWTWVRAGSDSLASYVPSVIAYGPPDDARE
jgi:hypothetical protein